MSALDVMRRVLTAYETHDLLGMEAHMQELRLAIEQAERQEPVCDKDPRGCWNVRCQLGKVCKNAVPPSQPLMDEEIEDLYFDGFSISKLKEFARAIERAHGIGGGE